MVEVEPPGFDLHRSFAYGISERSFSTCAEWVIAMIVPIIDAVNRPRFHRKSFEKAMRRVAQNKKTGPPKKPSMEIRPSTNRGSLENVDEVSSSMK